MGGCAVTTPTPGEEPTGDPSPAGAGPDRWSAIGGPADGAGPEVFDTRQPAPVDAEKVSRRRLRLRTVLGLVSFAVVVALVAAASLVHLPYVIFRPGPALNTLGTISVDGKDVPIVEVPAASSHPVTGTLDMTTVRVQGGPGYVVNGFDLLFAWLSEQQDIYPVDEVFPPQATQQQVTQQGEQEMRSSQDDAAAVAERALGYSVPETITVVELTSGSPAKGILQPGDVLVDVAGHAVTSVDQIRSELQHVRAGATVTITVERSGKRVTLSVPTTSVSGQTVVGVILQVAPQLPLPVTINAGNIGGPSAGMMFALAVYDKLSPGSLTGGKAIAGTGTIDIAGQVGPIGGIRQKMFGAQQSGASWFLAPAADCAEAVGHVPEGLRVVKVSTFADAVAAVKAIAAGHGGQLAGCNS